MSDSHENTLCTPSNIVILSESSECYSDTGTVGSSYSESLSASNFASEESVDTDLSVADDVSDGKDIVVDKYLSKATQVEAHEIRDSNALHSTPVNVQNRTRLDCGSENDITELSKMDRALVDVLSHSLSLRKNLLDRARYMEVMFTSNISQVDSVVTDIKTSSNDGRLGVNLSDIITHSDNSIENGVLDGNVLIESLRNIIDRNIFGDDRLLGESERNNDDTKRSTLLSGFTLGEFNQSNYDEVVSDLRSLVKKSKNSHCEYVGRI